jgi:hypothetical protein
MEQTSSTAMIVSLRDQISQNESSLSTNATMALQLVQLRAELATSQSQHKEVEEKLTKAVNLLKTVRGKLVNVQKDREDALKAVEDERRERTKTADALEKLRVDKEREMQSLRQAFEKESQGLKDKFARESLAEKRKWELEIITTKVCLDDLLRLARKNAYNPTDLAQASHAKDLASKSKHLNTLTESIKELNEEKRRQFELLQSRQEEIETAVVGKEVSEAKLKELSLEANEALERATLAEEALAEVKRELVQARSNRATEIETSRGHDSPAALTEAKTKAESRLKQVRDELSKLERERIEMEEEHARQLRSQRAEIDRVRGILTEKNQEISTALQGRKHVEDRLVSLEREKEALRITMEDVQSTLRSSREAEAKAADGEVRRLSSHSLGRWTADRTVARPRSNRRLTCCEKRYPDYPQRRKMPSRRLSKPKT